MELKEKLSNIQQKIKAPKNMYNTFGNYNYRNAESILESFKPFESEYKVALIISDDITIVGDRIYVQATATLMDCESSEQIASKAFARESLNKKGMDDSQITGTASSYARKYALNGLFLLDDTKDSDTDENMKERNERQKYNQKEAERRITAKRKEIESICQKHNLTPETICKANKQVWKDLDESMIDSMLVSLKKKFGDS